MKVNASPQKDVITGRNKSYILSGQAASLRRNLRPEQLHSTKRHFAGRFDSDNLSCETAISQDKFLAICFHGTA